MVNLKLLVVGMWYNLLRLLTAFEVAHGVHQHLIVGLGKLLVDQLLGDHLVVGDA